MTQNTITAERRRLAPYIERVNGSDMRESFREAFDGAAGRYALGKIDGPEFTGIVGELIRDAAGTAAEQDRRADVREPWATMPVDGSGRPTRWEWAVIVAVLVASLLVVVRVAGLVWSDWSAADAPAEPVPVTITGTPAGAGDPDRVAARELIIEGAYLSWQAYTECGEGSEACDRALREINANPYGVHFFEDGSAVDSARN